jgi:streptogramin lyase
MGSRYYTSFEDMETILVKYQGNTVETFTTTNLISSLAKDKEGNLWIGELNVPENDHYEPLVKYDGENWRTFNAPLQLGHTPMWIGEIIFDDLGNLWMAGKFGVGIDSHEEKLLKFDGTVWEVYELPPVGGWINSVALQDNSIIWLVTTRGLMKFSTSQWTAYDTENSDLPTYDINSLVVDDDGTKWLGTENGVVAFKDIGLTPSTDVYSKKMKEIELFPNPAHDFITLKLPHEFQGSTVEILNINGEAIKSFNIGNNQNQLDVSHLPAGIYLVRIQSNENQIVKKFVKQ